MLIESGTMASFLVLVLCISLSGCLVRCMRPATAEREEVHVYPDSNRHHPRLLDAETGDVYFKSTLYEPQRLELLEIKDADYAVHTDFVVNEEEEHFNIARMPLRRKKFGKHNRQKRGANHSLVASLQEGPTLESTLHVLEVYPRPAKVTFKMLSSHDQSERLNIDNLDYGSYYESWSELALSDKFNAVAQFEAGFREVYEDQLSSLTYNSKVPHIGPDELLVVVDGNISLSLHATVFFFSSKMRIPKGQGWAYVYNALIPFTQSSLDGLDVIVYAPQHLKNNIHPLLRLGSNIPLNNGTEVFLPAGMYQLKVARRGSIVDICDFQATMSFIPPTCIHIKEATHQYLVLHGIVESTFTSDFPPNVMMVPADLCVAAERKETKVTAYFLNAYLAADHQFNHPVTFSFPGLYYSLSLPPHSAESRELSLHDGDCFKVHTKGQTTNPPPVQVDATDSSLCVFLVDNNMANGHIDAFHHCWAKYMYLAPQAAWIFSYNTLDRGFPPIDVIILQLDNDMNTDPWMYKIMHNASVGEGMPALVDARTYIVKTFPAYTVHTPEEFYNTSSLTDVSIIDFKPLSYHFNVMYGGKVGINRSVINRGRVLLEPPSSINSEEWLRSHLTNESATLGQAAPPPVTRSSSSSSTLQPHQFHHLLVLLVMYLLLISR